MREMSLGIFVLVGLVLGAEPALPADPSSQVQWRRVEPTVLLTAETPPRQEIWLQIENAGQPFEASLRVSSKGQVIGQAKLGQASKGTTDFEVLLPAPERPVDSQWVLLDAKGQVRAEHRVQWNPPRRWKLYVLKSAHIDIGLHSEPYLQRDLVGRSTDEAIRLCDQTADWPEASRFRYTIEHIWWLLNFAADRSPDEVRRLVQQYVLPGRIGVGAGHSGNHTQEFGTEELCRSAYYSRREARIRWGLDLQCAVFSDINGLSWPLADVYSEAGMRYIGFYPNPWRGSVHLDHESGVPAELFYWESPSKQGRLLVWASLHYTGGPRFGLTRKATVQTLKKPLASALRALESKWPYDVWLVPWYEDNEEPNLRFAELARQWNAQWGWPVLHTVGDPAEVFRQVEERFRDGIPVRRGDITPSWAQHPVSSPEYLGRKRAADRLLTTAEKLATLARLVQPQFLYPTLNFRQAWNSLVQSDEHGYGVSEYTGKKVYVTWAHKRNWIDHALQVAQTESERALAVLVSSVPVDQVPAVVVFNPLLGPRTDVVSFRLPAEVRLGQVTELGRVDPLPTQIDGDQLRFVAPEVPALGYKVFRLLTGEGPSCQRQESAEPPVVENRFYRLRFAPNGSIASLFEKELQRECVDQEAPYHFNEFVFTWDDHRSFTTPSRATFQLEKTSVAQRVIARMEEPRSGAKLTQTITLYEHEKRIDLDNRLDQVAGIFGYPRYQVYGYYAFPFEVPGGIFQAQLNGCIARPGEDQCPIGTLDWLAVQDWVDVANSEFGVTLAQRESHLVEFGTIRTNQNSHEYRPTSSHIYSYLFNNWYQNGWAAWPGPKHVHLRYQYAIRSHRGDARAGKASEFGRRFAYPLLAAAVVRPQSGQLPAGGYSFGNIQASNGDLLTLKLSEAPGQGVIARLVETEGVPVPKTVFRLAWPQLSRTIRCSVVEEDRAELPGGQIGLKPFEIATVRLQASESGPPAPSLQAAAVSEKAIRLSWRPVPGAVQYHLFRSNTPEFPAEVYYLAAVTTKTEYIDECLDRGTRWYYRVAAVSAANQQGELSGVVEASTFPKGDSPPCKVGVHYTGLIWAPQAWHGDRPDILHLLWGRNPESDIAYYELHRSLQPDFVPSPETFVAKVPPGTFAVVSYDDQGLQPGTTYYYQVCAVDEEGHRGPFSDPWKGTTRDPLTLQSPQTPSAAQSPQQVPPATKEPSPERVPKKSP